MSGHIPPSNLDAERSLLGGILLDPSSLDGVIDVLTTADFFRDAHARVYGAILGLHADQKPIDRVALKDELRARGELDAAGGEDAIDYLDSYAPTAPNLRYYAGIIREKAIARRIIDAGNEIVRMAYQPSGDIAELADFCERRVLDATAQRAQGGLELAKPAVLATFKKLETLYERQEEITGIPTGLVDLDRLTAGLQPGDLMVLAARPSMGKTALALNLAVNVAARSTYEGRRCAVGVFTLEMPKEQLITRALASEARVDSSRLRTGRLIESDWGKLASGGAVLGDAALYLDDNPGLSVLELRTRARRLATRLAATPTPLRLLVVDYLQLIRGEGREREQQVADISRGLKTLAKELSIPVIALSQLNRSLEKRPDKRPMMSDLRESGAIEQDADIIAFLYRAEVYRKDDENVRGLAELIVGKHRNGPIGTVYLTFQNEFTRFDSAAGEAVAAYQAAASEED